jgi:hypothetical protein
MLGSPLLFPPPLLLGASIMNSYFKRAFLAAALLGVACDSAHRIAAPPRGAPGLPAFAISDAAHGGSMHFYFLPPMVSNPSAVGAFDPNVAPIVDVCAWNGSACAAPAFATFTTTTGPGSETVRVSLANEQYIVNWDTGPFNLVSGATYRIRVRVKNAIVGFADVAIVANGSQAKNVTTGENIPLVDGRTLPIKFRIEQGMPVAVTITPNPLALTTGAAGALTAVVVDAHDNSLIGTPVTWTSSNPATAGVNASGLVTGVAPGDVVITATSGGASGTANVSVAANQCVAPQGTPLGFWPFEEGTGSSTADVSGNGHTGTLQGSPLWTNGANDVGNAVAFNNPTDLVNVGSFLSTAVASLSVGAWVYPTSFSNTGDIAAGGISGPRIISATDGEGWAIGHAPGAGNIQVELRGIASFILGTTLPLNTWSNVVVVYDGTSVMTYLNGTLLDSRLGAGGTVRQASSCTFIGNEPEGCSRQTNGNFAWQGRIDEVVVYDRPVTPSEVQALYQRCTVNP